MAQTKKTILAVLKRHSAELHGFGVVGLALFGSFVKGRDTSASDIDILVEFAPGAKTFDHFMDLSFYLEDLLGRPVHLVTAESISPRLKPYIMDEAEYATLTA